MIYECGACGERLTDCPCCGAWATVSGLVRYCHASGTGRHVLRAAA